MKVGLLVVALMLASSGAQAASTNLLDQIACASPEAVVSFKSSLAILSDALGVPTESFVRDGDLASITVAWFNASHRGAAGMSCSWAPVL